MKALVYHGPDDLRLEERPTPEPGSTEALLRVAACGICGTDLRILSGAHRAYPAGTERVPGHELAGTIVATGGGSNLAVGDTVFVAPNIGCLKCAQCRNGRVNLCEHPQAIGITRDGAMAEYVLLPAELITQGNVMTFGGARDFGAIALVEPLACVLRGSRAVDIRSDDLVLIYGAGPIGLLHLQTAKLRAPRAVVVCEPNPERRNQAVVWGADQAVAPEELAALIAEMSGGRGVDVTIVAAPSSQAQEDAVRLAATGGRINFFGGLPSGRSLISLDSNIVHYRELIITGTTANSTEDCREALDLVTSGAIETGRLISHRWPLHGSARAFAAARSGQSLKVVLEP